MAVGDRDFFKDLMLHHQLPTGWFDEDGQVINAVLDALATAPAFDFDQLLYVAQQNRLATATEMNLDLIAEDFFGKGMFRRRKGEGDESYRSRIAAERLRPRATRQAMIDMITDLTGVAPVIFEPGNVSDTGSYGYDMAYGEAGAYGSLNQPYEFFMTVTRPLGQGIPDVAGYGSDDGAYGAGNIEYASLDNIEGEVTDTEIYQSIARTVPAGVTAWTKIKSGT